MNDLIETVEDMKFTYWESIPVRWGDMDAMGHINNAKYLTYMESGRMGYFGVVDLFGFDEHGKLMPVVANVSCNFRKQVKHPARLLVGTRNREIRTRSFILEYVILEEGPARQFETVADGTSAVVWIDKATGKAVPISVDLRAALETGEQHRTLPVGWNGE